MFACKAIGRYPRKQCPNLTSVEFKDVQGRIYFLRDGTRGRYWRALQSCRQHYMSRAFCFLSFTNFSQGSGDTKSKNWIWCFGSGVSAQWQLSVAVQDCGRGRGVSCTARGEVRSHINYFSPHSADGLPPTTRVSHSPTRAASERARNQSLSLFLRLPTTVSLSLVLSLRIFPNFVSVLLPFPHSLPHPYALREIDFSTESPLPAFATRGTKKLQCFCNVFDIVHASRNYFCIKKPNATSR